MTQNLTWELKEDTTNELEAAGENIATMPESKFSFAFARYKGVDTKRERLVIKCLLENVSNGEAETTIDNLDKAFNELMQYGVVFSNDNELIKLKRKIKKIYLDITIIEVKEDDIDDRFIGFLKAIGEYIKLSEKDNTDDLCFISVAVFDDIVKDCGYKSYEMQNLRKKLKDKKYIRSIGERIAIIVRYQGKPSRVIAFLRKKMQDEKYITERNENGDTKDENETKISAQSK